GRRRPLRLLTPVRVRVTLVAALMTVVAVGAAGWLLVRAVEGTQMAQLRRDTEAGLDRVAERLEQGVPPQTAAEDVGPLVIVQIVDEDGRTVAATPLSVRQGQQVAVGLEGGTPAGAGGGDTLVLAPEPGDQVVTRTLPPPDESGGTVDDDPGGGDGTRAGQGVVRLVSADTVFSAPLERSTREVSTPSGDLRVIAALPVDEVERSLDAVRRALLLGLPGLVVLVAAVAWAVVGRALRPVEAIRAEVEAISASTMHRRVPEPGTADEIGRLARTMNAMLARLEGSAARQRQFVSDASHELRSPVAAIRIDLEVALREGDAADWPGVARSVLDEEGRLEDLLSDLLTLAADDEGPAVRPPATPVDLLALARADAARGRRVPVEVAGPGGTAAGAADQLARVVANLVDNAARHARSAVRVTVAPGRLTVDDDGPGVPPDQREVVFERFTRLDAARTRDGGGAGLGLAVVRSIVTRHGGTVAIADAPAGGARVTVTLPTAADPAGERLGEG
ncbi:MAG TPA: HAMP domain-containing sensor histidine kinase, partial [Acidimicrobiales bacterium]